MLNIRVIKYKKWVFKTDSNFNFLCDKKRLFSGNAFENLKLIYFSYVYKLLKKKKLWIIVAIFTFSFWGQAKVMLNLNCIFK